MDPHDNIPTQFQIHETKPADLEPELRGLPLHELLLARGSMHGPYRRTNPYRGRRPVSRAVRALAAFLMAPRAKL